ncbi:MAG TPA: hypothetical protein VNK96_09120 [Fimbriimonadales bacterium]|nr:hypothetical protein [Fimbriimonadales bacterium]
MVLGLIFYALVSLAITFGILVIRAWFTRVGILGEHPATQRLLMIWIIVFALPYIWVEVLTFWKGKEFEEEISYIAYSEKILGEPLYYKVQYAFRGTGKVILIAEDTSEWGGTFRNIYSISFSHNGKGWVAKRIDEVNTEDGDSAGFTFPPYW